MVVEKVYAQGVSTNIINPLGGGFNNIGDIFAFAVNLLIGIGWALVFVMLALGFIQYVVSKGEKSAVESAQKWLTYAVIGGVGLFFISFLKGQIPSLLGGNGINSEDTGGITDF